MKKYFVAFPIVIIYSIIFLIGIFGFIWESVDVNRFVPFAFITSVCIPCVIELILITLFFQYITIDENGIKKYFLKKQLRELNWNNILEIKIDKGYIYISLEQLHGPKKQWNRKKYIFVMYSEKLAKEIKRHVLEKTTINF